MIIKIRNSRITKGIAIFLITNLLTEIINPIQLYALTAGPSQPEMTGFTPIDTNGMVDMFSGDFRYTIPLMTVPGPNGGYPINLNYRSGAGMEHEASWVGLGWNLNPGAVNRQVRGLPDDFNGEDVKKTYKRRDNKTIVFRPGTGVELLGANFGIGINVSNSFIYNTYAGMSTTLNFGVASSFVRRNEVHGDSKFSVGLGVNLDSDNGITPSFSMGGGAKNLSYNANFGYNCKSGTYTFSSQVSYGYPQNYSGTYKGSDGAEIHVDRRDPIAGGSIGHSFSSAAYLPPIYIPLSTSTYGGSFQFGGQTSAAEYHGALSASVCTQKTPSGAIKTPAYGLMYAENADYFSLRDFNREKELAVDHNSLNLPLPVLTYDIYNITGETMGGSFRAYRSDMGYMCNNRTTNENTALTIGGDAGIGYGFQIGVDYSDNVGSSVSGGWEKGDFDNNLYYKSKETYAGFSARNISPVLYEPFYFKMLGEQTAIQYNPLEYIGGEAAVAYKLETNAGASKIEELTQTNYTVGNKLKKADNTVVPMSQYALAERAKRSQLIEYRTNNELNRATSTRKGHHIGEISVVNTNGERYTYGEPLYNTLEKEVSFSIPAQNVSFSNSITYNYLEGNARGTERVGKEKLYSCTETPPYAYSHLITSITSADYVDWDKDGKPSDKDLGYWVRFSYTRKHSGYQWRFPYEGANLSLGEISNDKDDKGSYQYGIKEVAYVDTIETKTHFARFYISERQDGYEAGNEYMGGLTGAAKTLYKLDSIRLYSKSDLSRPVKTVVFEYNYSLCPGVYNNRNGSGKLTLAKVYFKYNGSEKGKDAPYEFTYHYASIPYNPVKMDRWGNYKEDADYFNHYVTQVKYYTDDWSKTWNLWTIKLPSGGNIKIDYESDDYAYVQNKQAMQMMQMNERTSFEEENGAYYVYFNKIWGEDARKYVSGFTNNMMFFKVAVKAKNGAPYSDYVQGYVKIKPETVFDYGSYAKVQVEPFKAYDKIHPIYLLCCQYLKNNRPDILFGLDDMDDDASDLEGFCNSLISKGMLSKVEMMFGKNNFYRFCLSENFFRYLDINYGSMPSYVRLNVPGKIKYGGGCRVKTITLDDRWSKSDPEVYTQKYYYCTLENDKVISSGVAEYEPMVCAEETALRYPVYDRANGTFFKEDEMYSEVPYGESYFPASNVGYGKVIVETVVPLNVTKNASGVQVHEFYTAKDFPIWVSETYLEKENNFIPNIIKELLTGFKQANSSAYSQGYMIELNDMHGKPKSVATYPWRSFIGEEGLLAELGKLGATSKVEYFYKTKKDGRRVELDNKVDVLVGDNQVKNQIMGQTFDFIVDFRENYSYSESFGLSGNGGVLAYMPWPLPFVSAIPSFDSFEERVRSVATTKVIYKTAILEKTVATNNGSVVVSRNLQWDPYTGQPLLTSVTNDFDQPVYQYSMPAYWNYPDMGAACENYRAYYQDGFPLSEFSNYIRKYDKIGADKTLDTARILYSAMTFTCWRNGSSQYSLIRPPSLEVMRSRKANRLTPASASLVSLTNPSSERRFPLFDAFNAANDLPTNPCFRCTDCNGSSYYAKIIYSGGRLYFIKPRLDVAQENCASVGIGSYPQVVSPSVSLTGSVYDYLFIKEGNLVHIRKRSNKDHVTTFAWSDPQNLFPECLDGVLQASATEFRPGWTYDYTDAGISGVSSGLESYFGIPNRHNPLRSNLFPVARKQEGAANDYKTNIAYDGTFDFFQFFNHVTGNETNQQDPWTWTAEITRLSPYNFELENKNALGIYSSALYGYNNSLATAAANNARYYEIAFDGFENDPLISISNWRGHFKFNFGQGAVVTNEHAHTGDYSVKHLANRNFTITAKVSAGGSDYTPSAGALTLIRGKKYVLSFWAKSNCETLNNKGDTYNMTVYGISSVLTREEKIDCWQRLAAEFTVPLLAGTELEIKISPSFSRDYYLDDFRIFPFNANMKTYVYHPQNYRLLAELDENNYATLYNYDEEGILVQVKKETERGIMTLQTTRQHLRGKNN